MIIIGVASTCGSIASLNWLARCSGSTRIEKVPLVPSGISRIRLSPVRRGVHDTKPASRALPLNSRSDSGCVMAAEPGWGADSVWSELAGRRQALPRNAVVAVGGLSKTRQFWVARNLQYPEIVSASPHRARAAFSGADDSPLPSPSRTMIMTAIADTPFAKLEAEGRLQKPILNADTHVAGRFGYRGEISYDGPETLLKEVFSVSEAGKPAIGFLAGSIKQYESLPKLVETFGTAFNGDGKYFIYIADLPQGNRFYLRFGDVKIFAIFIDETTVYNELIDTFYVDKVKLKKLSIIHISEPTRLG